MLTADERKERLDIARRALREVDVQLVRAAMEGLPEDGAKSAALRSMLRERIWRLETALKEARPVVRPELTRIATEYAIALTSDSLPSGELFKVSLEGGRIAICINIDHPATQALRSGRGQVLDPAAALLLVGMAILEAEAGTERKRERIRDMRGDLSRVLARLTRSS